MKKRILSILCCFATGLLAFPIKASAKSNTEMDAVMARLSQYGSLQPVDETPSITGILNALTAVHDHNRDTVVDEQTLKPAEITEDGTAYVGCQHIQELNGLLVKCDNPEALDQKQVGDSQINVTDYTWNAPYAEGAYNLSVLSNYFTNNYNRQERIRGEFRETNNPELQQMIEDGICILDMEYGSKNAEKEDQIVRYLTESADAEIIGILQTDWYIKSAYTGLDVFLTVTPAPGAEVDVAALDTDEYHHLHYLGGSASLSEEGLPFDEVAALCEKLEARDDISYAWVIPEYLEDLYANDSDYSFSMTMIDPDNPTTPEKEVISKPTVEESFSAVMEALTKVHNHTRDTVVDEQTLRPAEIAENGTAYVGCRHIQELNGLLIKCENPSWLNSATMGNRKQILITDYTEKAPYVEGHYNLSLLSDYFTNYYDLQERVRGEVREADNPELQKMIEDGICILNMDYGEDNLMDETTIVRYLTEYSGTEIIGILQTDWYIKSAYTGLDVFLTVTPAPGAEVDVAALDTDEYHHLHYLGGSASLSEEGLPFDEVAALCEKLEARDDIAYAWVIPEYLEDLYANDSDFSFALTKLSSEPAVSETEPVVTEPQQLSDEMLCEWAAKDYADKHQTAVTAAITGKDGDKVTISLTDASGNVVDTYTVDAAIGIGENAGGEEINLPQTGNNGISNLLLAIAALMMVAVGAVTLSASGIIRRRQNQK